MTRETTGDCRDHLRLEIDLGRQPEVCREKGDNQSLLETARDLQRKDGLQETAGTIRSLKYIACDYRRLQETAGATGDLNCVRVTAREFREK